jgi:Zn-dependent protease with chaperone function
MRRLAPAWLLLSALLLAACAEAYRIRPIRLDERARLTLAADPLLRELGLLDRGQGCQFAVTLNDVESRSLEVVGPTSTYCVGFVITSGTLALPPDELRALVAHGLAHLQLGHATTTRVGTGARASARGFSQARLHSAAEEADADREAARLLTLTAAAGSSCRALGDVLDRGRAEGQRWSEWTTQHPLRPARVEAARALCAD